MEHLDCAESGPDGCREAFYQPGSDAFHVRAPRHRLRLTPISHWSEAFLTSKRRGAVLATDRTYRRQYPPLASNCLLSHDPPLPPSTVILPAPRLSD
ncbi:hypothetical protein CBOM_07900 [Ceraceosorus bombacis]|uniref:Uncharacterized protein n=1 Tax=Ceraceosorus bombacis TaxID=401625 RepID=A0A0P1BP16_9BASI|nr:hypothetical protein CBOM_07900 [Ceraceosorus bombacis]